MQFTRDWTELRHRIANMEAMFKPEEEEEDADEQAEAHVQETKSLRSQLRSLVQASEKIRADLDKMKRGWMNVPTGKYDKHDMPKMKMVRTFERMPDEEVYDNTLKIEMDMEAFKGIVKHAAADATVLRDFHKHKPLDEIPDAPEEEQSAGAQVQQAQAAESGRLVDLLGLDSFENDAEAMDEMLQQFEKQVQERMARHQDAEAKKHDKEYECVICTDMSDTGVLCEEDHFMCLGCLSNYLDSESFNIANLRRNCGSVACPNWNVTGCKSAPFDADRIDEYITEPIRDKLDELKRRVIDVEDALSRHANRVSADPIKDGANYIRRLREEVEEDIMVMRCPKCR